MKGSGMLRKATLSLLPVLACVGVMPAQAAPRTATIAVSVAVAKQCSFGTAPTMLPSATAASTGLTIAMSGTNSWSWTVRCNAPATLTVTATPLKSGTGSSARYANFKTTVTSWNGTNSFVTLSNKNGNPASNALSIDSTGGATTTIGIGASTPTVTSNETASPPFSPSAAYSGTIALTLAAK